MTDAQCMRYLLERPECQIIKPGDPDPLVVENLEHGAVMHGVLGDKLFFDELEGAADIKPELSVEELLRLQPEVKARSINALRREEGLAEVSAARRAG